LTDSLTIKGKIADQVRNDVAFRHHAITNYREDKSMNNNNGVFINDDGHPQTQGSGLLALYNAIDWIDFILIFVIIGYVGIAPIAVDFADFAAMDWATMWDMMVSSLTIVDLLLCTASLIVTIAAIVTAILIFKKGLNKNPFRLVLWFIVWGVWIPVDVYLIVMALRNLA
jgi:hypothetical protein